MTATAITKSFNEPEEGLQSAIDIALSQVKDKRVLSRKEAKSLFRKIAKLQNEILESGEIDAPIESARKRRIKGYHQNFTTHILKNPDKYKIRLTQTAQKLQELCDTAFDHNLRLAAYCTKKFFSRHQRELRAKGVDEDDCFEASYTILRRAINRFDHTKGYTFSTFAVKCIENTLKDIKKYHSSGIRIPATVLAERNRINKAKEFLSAQGNHHPSIEEIADTAKMKPKKVRNILKHIREITSINQTTPEHDNRDQQHAHTLADQRPDIDPVENTIDKERKETLKILINALPLKQQKVIKYRAQTSTTGYQMTLKETGQRIGITRERVRQIQDRATEKLTELKDIFDELKTIQSAKFQAWHESLFSDNETHLHKLATLYLQTGATISEIQDQYKAEKLVNLIKESTTGPTSQKQIEEKAAKIEEQLAFNINKIISILKRVTTLQDAEFEDYFKSLFADDEQALAKRVLKAIQQTYTPAEVLNRIKINGITTQIIDSLNKDQVTLDMLQTKKEVVLVGSAQKDKKNLEAYRNAIRKGIVQTFKQASDQRTENPSKQIIKLEERQKPPANNQSTQNTETLERRLA